MKIHRFVSPIQNASFEPTRQAPAGIDLGEQDATASGAATSIKKRCEALFAMFTSESLIAHLMSAMGRKLTFRGLERS